LRRIGDIVRVTHERWDGDGYPDGLSGEAIPLAARIITVCDAYDAMTTTRPYRPALSVETALAELELCAGSQFDPNVVAVATDAIRQRQRIAA
jgi:HD-GYP domain-containing protein (c-di-GMP phosphodiesterase class II)